MDGQREGGRDEREGEMRAPITTQWNVLCA